MVKRVILKRKITPPRKFQSYSGLIDFQKLRNGTASVEKRETNKSGKQRKVETVVTQQDDDSVDSDTLQISFDCDAVQVKYEDNDDDNDEMVTDETENTPCNRSSDEGMDTRPSVIQYGASTLQSSREDWVNGKNESKKSSRPNGSVIKDTDHTTDSSVTLSILYNHLTALPHDSAIDNNVSNGPLNLCTTLSHSQETKDSQAHVPIFTKPIRKSNNGDLNAPYTALKELLSSCYRCGREITRPSTFNLEPGISYPVCRRCKKKLTKEKELGLNLLFQQDLEPEKQHFSEIGHPCYKCSKVCYRPSAVKLDSNTVGYICRKCNNQMTRGEFRSMINVSLNGETQRKDLKKKCCRCGLEESKFDSHDRQHILNHNNKYTCRKCIVDILNQYSSTVVTQPTISGLENGRPNLAVDKDGKELPQCSKNGGNNSENNKALGASVSSSSDHNPEFRVNAAKQEVSLKYDGENGWESHSGLHMLASITELSMRSDVSTIKFETNGKHVENTGQGETCDSRNSGLNILAKATEMLPNDEKPTTQRNCGPGLNVSAEAKEMVPNSNVEEKKNTGLNILAEASKMMPSLERKNDYKPKHCGLSMLTKVSEIMLSPARENVEQKRSSSLGTKKYQCRQCNKAFTSRSYLNVHSRNHDGIKPFSCRWCDMTFSTSCHLTTHEYIHTRQKPYICEHCGKRFSTSSYLNIHERLHTGDAPYQCKWCGQRFIRSSYLAYHLKVHVDKEEMLPCREQWCSKKFKTVYALNQHYLEAHGIGSKPHVCQLCNRHFASSSYLISHMGRMHVGMSDTVEEDNFEL